MSAFKIKAQVPPAITGMTLENFKGVGKAITIPLKPITLLFGENSAGKSTILHGLLYLSEILNKRVADVDNVALGGSAIRLGGFKSFVHRHDQTRDVCVGVTCSLNDQKIACPPAPPRYNPKTDTREPADDAQCFDINKLLKIREVSCKVSIAHGGAHGAVVRALTVGLNNRDVLYAEGEGSDGGYPRYRLNESHPLLKAIYSQAPLLHSTSKPLHPLLCWLEEARGLDGEQCLIPDLDHATPIEMDYLDHMYPRIDETVRSIVNEHGNKISVFFWQLLIGIPRCIREQLNMIRYTGPIRVSPPRGAVDSWPNTQPIWADGSAAWQCLVDPTANIIPQYPDTSDLLLELTGKKEVVDRTSQNYPPEVVTNQPRFHLTDDEVISRVNTLLNRLDLGYEIRGVRNVECNLADPRYSALKSLSNGGEEHAVSKAAEEFVSYVETLPRRRTFAIVDKQSGLDLHPAELGIGVSQVVPIIVSCVVNDCRLYAVEQPELHLHPRAQCNLADVFVQSAHPYGMRLLIETHSEHLVLRLLRRVRETTQGKIDDKSRALKKEALEILYVERTKDGIKITRLPVDDDGEFTRPWPHGFFEERAEELF